MNFRQIKQRLAQRRGARDDNFNAATEARYANAVNEAHRGLLRMPGMESLRYGTVTFASVANQKLYGLPAEGLARINRITETTNDRRLVYKTPDWLDTVAPDPTTGTPWAYIPRGYSDVHTQPSDASELFVKSTSASDTSTAFVEVITTGGYTQDLQVAMTGTTAVSLSSSVTDAIVVTKFYLSAGAVGTVTLHEDSGSGTELSRIAAKDVRAQFHIVQLYTTPSAVITYTVDVLRSIPDMAKDTDEPLIPEDFHDLLIDLAEVRELRKADDPQRFQMLAADVERGKRDLRSFVINHPDWRPLWNERAAMISSLGSWFPSDINVG